jgi:molybdate transport system substrate-binding protein
MRIMRMPAVVAMVASVAGALLAGCGASAGAGAGAPGSRTLTVLAAASLTESFAALERRFEAEHPGVDVRLSLEGSRALAQQIVNGARAEVFASADEATMRTVVDAGLAGPTTVFATNRLAIAVPAGNPMGITTLADLADPKLTVVVCAPQVPCGAAARQVQAAARVTLIPASEEQDVKAVLTKVRAGEADAGLVYVTDIASAGGTVTGVDIPEAGQAVNRYPIATLRDATHPDLAAAFVALVLGPAGRAELAKVGFGVP